jgi:hypothetical protein
MEPMEGEDKESEIIDVMVRSIWNRIFGVSKLESLCHLDTKYVASYQLGFPIEAVNCLVETFDRPLNAVRCDTLRWRWIAQNRE